MFGDNEVLLDLSAVWAVLKELCWEWELLGPFKLRRPSEGGREGHLEATWRPLGAHLEAKWSPSPLEVHLKGENAPRAGEELILEGLRRHLKGENAPRAGEELILEGVQVHLKYT